MMILQNNANTKPIKRHKAIVQFSREHHFGLLLCWKIKQGIKKNIAPERIASYILFFFDNDLENHFREEERIMFSKLPADDPFKIRAMSEHDQIYLLITRIRTGQASYALLTEFAEALDAHIRFEERTLFSHLQRHLSERELVELEKAHNHNSADPDAHWNDPFWN